MIVRSETGVTVTAAGELDEQSLEGLVEALEALVPTGGTLNLSRVTFLPSRAVGEIIVVRKRIQRTGGDLRIVVGHGTIVASILRVLAVPHHAE